MFIGFEYFVFQRYVIAFCNFICRMNLKEEARRLIRDRVRQARAIHLLRHGAVITNYFTCCVRQDTFAFNGLTCIFGNFLFGGRSRTLLAFIYCGFFDQRHFITSERFTRVSRTTAFFCRLERAISISNQAIIVGQCRQVFVLFTGDAGRIINAFLRFYVNALCNVRLSSTTMTAYVGQ